MFSFIKQVFIVLLSFSSSLTRVAKVSDQTICLSLNDEPCMVKPIFTGLNTVERKYYSFMISLDKCNYYADNSYLLVNGKEIFKYKADNKNVNFPTQFCLGSISNGFSTTESREYL